MAARVSREYSALRGILSSNTAAKSIDYVVKDGSIRHSGSSHMILTLPETTREAQTVVEKQALCDNAEMAKY